MRERDLLFAMNHVNIVRIHHSFKVSAIFLKNREILLREYSCWFICFLWDIRTVNFCTSTKSSYPMVTCITLSIDSRTSQKCAVSARSYPGYTWLKWWMPLSICKVKILFTEILNHWMLCLTKISTLSSLILEMPRSLSKRPIKNPLLNLKKVISLVMKMMKNLHLEMHLTIKRKRRTERNSRKQRPKRIVTWLQCVRDVTLS